MLKKLRCIAKGQKGSKENKCIKDRIAVHNNLVHTHINIYVYILKN